MGWQPYAPLATIEDEKAPAMASPPDPHLTDLLYRALAAPIGIAIRVSHAERARQAIYQARSKLGDDQLARLSIRLNPLLPEQELWLIKVAKPTAQVALPRTLTADDL